MEMDRTIFQLSLDPFECTFGEYTALCKDTSGHGTQPRSHVCLYKNVRLFWEEYGSVYNEVPGLIDLMIEFFLCKAHAILTWHHL